jgi:hypothetical protein
MPSQTQYCPPVFLESFATDSASKKLERVHLTKKGSESPSYDEAWLQKLISDHPGLLSIGEIEPQYTNMVPVCTELSVRGNSADNLFMTPTGDLILVECKLYRNSEARREVIAQIIDYASEMSSWSYQQLEQAVIKALKGQSSSQSLYQIVAAHGEMNEVEFHDAVSRNLRRGRFLLMIVGDGIREDLEAMADFLQQHAGLHFRLVLLELALFQVPEGGYFVQPRLLAKTKVFERGVVTLQDDRMQFVPSKVETNKAGLRSGTLSEEEFFERLGKGAPAVSEKLKAFLEELADVNVHPEFGSPSLILRWVAEDGRCWNLATIVPSGDVWMDYHGQQASNLNLREESKRYLQNLADLVPGAMVKHTKKQTAWNLAGPDGHAMRLEALLADESRASGWLKAIQEFQNAVRRSSAG